LTKKVYYRILCISSETVFRVLFLLDTFSRKGEKPMARIPESEIERLKREVSLERLAAARGIQLQRHGADLIGLCPFHEDHQPSLVISPKKNLWHCLGACRAGGSVIDWVMRAQGVSFRHAVELLRSDLLPSASQGEPPKRSTVTKLPAPIVRDAGDHEVLLEVVNFYHEALKQSPEALQYLEKRGLKSSEMVEHFQLGFANRTLGYRLPHKNRQEGAELREACKSWACCARPDTSTSTAPW